MSPKNTKFILSGTQDHWNRDEFESSIDIKFSIGDLVESPSNGLHYRVYRVVYSIDNNEFLVYAELD